MGDPEIFNDEKVLMRTPGVYVKSIPFEGILTNKRVILVDRAKNLLPPKEIPLATITAVESSENAIRDQIITLSVMAKTGDTRQMILTFSRREGGNRIKERDAWTRAIRENAGSIPDNAGRRVITTTIAPPAPAAPPRINVVNSPVRPVAEPASPAPVPPAPTAPKYDTPVPAQYFFCSRCGNKVPADSAFCNRCGSPIVAPRGSTPAPQPPAPAAFPQAQTPQQVDREIQTIEPLIERSNVRIPSDPLRRPIQDIPLRQSPAWVDDVPPQSAPAPGTSMPSFPAEKPKKGGLISRLFSPGKNRQSPAPPVSSAAPPVVKKPRRSFAFKPSRNLLLGIGAFVLIVVIVAVGALFVYPMLTSGEGPAGPGTSAGVTTTPSSSGSTSAVLNPSGTIVPIEIQTSDIPPSGVYVHVNYLGGFEGKYGMPDALITVPGNSGDRVMEVVNATGTVVADFKKQDGGSKHELLVEIYKDGVLLTSDSTSVGYGSVKLSADIIV